MINNFLKIALRNLWKNKTFAAINVVGLALGITCGLGMFIIVRHDLSFDNFHPNHKQIYRIVSQFKYPEGIEYSSGVPLALPQSFSVDFPQIQKVATIFGGYNNQLDIMDENTQQSQKKFKIQTGVFYTNPAFFDVFNFKWLSGSAQTVLSAPNQAALTQDIAEKYFGSWQNALGKKIKKDNSELLLVAGILANPPDNTDFPLQIIISYTTLLNSNYGKALMNDWGTVTTRSQCYIVLPDDRERTRILTGLPAFERKHLGSDNTTDHYTLQPLGALHFDEKYGNFNLHTTTKKTLWSLLTIGIFLLVLACINFINLATAQATKRSREVGIRKVLGSQRWQIAFQFMGETLLIVAAAAMIAVVMLKALQPLTDKILTQPISLNPLQSPITIVISIAVIFVVTIISGFYPAIIVSGFRPIQALKNKIIAGRASGIPLRRVLVVIQFIIAQALIFATLVIVSQIKFFQNASLGFNSDTIITVNLPHDSVSKLQWEFFRKQLLQNPDVQNISLSYSPPSSQGTHTTTAKFNQTIKIEPFEVNMNAADELYFNTYQLKLVAGHFYKASDTATEAVVNETFLKKENILNPQDVLGKYIILDNVKLPIGGVVKDFHQHSLRGPIDPMVIVSQKKDYRIAGIKIHSKNIQGTLHNIEQLFNKTFPAYLFDYSFLDETIGKFYTQERRLSRLSSLFTAIGIFISCIGLYGLILFMTIQRIKEVGIRKILGASVSSIVLFFCREFIWLIVIAFLVAASLGWYFMNNWLNDFAYHIHIAWWMFPMVGLAALFLAMITVSAQTIKAAVSNPVKSLRSE
jgi:putative ABC transport system permease protein